MAGRRWTRSMDASLLQQRYKEFKRRREGGQRSGNGSSAQDNYNVRFGGNGGYSGGQSSSSSESESDTGVEFLGVERDSDEEDNGAEFLGTTRESADDAGTGESKVGGVSENTVQDDEVRCSSSSPGEDSDDLIEGSEEAESESEPEEKEDAEIDEPEREEAKEVINIDDSESESEPEEVQDVGIEAGEREKEEEVEIIDIDGGRMTDRSVPVGGETDEEQMRVVVEETEEDIQITGVDGGRKPDRSVPVGGEMDEEQVRVATEEEEEEGEEEEDVQIAAEKPEMKPRDLNSSRVEMQNETGVAGRTDWVWGEVRVVSKEMEKEDEEDNGDETEGIGSNVEDQQTEQEEIDRLWEELDLAKKEEQKSVPKRVVTNGFNGRGRKPKVGGLSSKADIERKVEIGGGNAGKREINGCDDLLGAEVARDEGKVEEVTTVDAAVEAEEKKQECMWKPSRKPRKVFQESEVVDILADSVLGDAELPVDTEEADNEPPAEHQRPVLTRRIYGCDEEASPPEKSEQEKEMDMLWEEMALALYGDKDSSGAVEEDISSPEPAIDSTRCRHDELRLDEEIGLICRRCHHIELEIRYYLPPFAEEKYRYLKEKPKRWDRRMFNGDEFYTQEDLENLHGKLHNHDDEEKDGTVWDIMPEIREGLHEHQRDGFEFLWRNIGGDIRLANLKSRDEEADAKRPSGCVISHAPGTGKTRLSIRFLQTYMKKFPQCKPMIIVPCSMLLTWEAEFKSLGVETPRHNLNDPKLTGKESLVATRLLQEYRGTQTVRWVKLYSWQKESGILLMSYKLYEELVGRGMRKKRKTEGTTTSSTTIRPIDERTKQVLLEVPGLVILDEGHNARNQDSLIWKALSNVKTQKRIVLSGTPFQNNFDEFFNILWLARPNFTDSIPSSGTVNLVSSRKRGKEVNEAREKWQSFTCHLGKDTDDWRKAKQLQDLRALIINPFVHTYKGDILQEKLPGLRDSVLILQPAEFQRGKIARIQAMSHTLGLRKKTLQYFHWEHALTLASVHPYLLANCKGQYQTEPVSESMLEQLKLDPEAGVKTKFLMELITVCEIIKEKVLVFSQFLDPLKMIAEQLETHRNWTADNDFLYMHGALTSVERQKIMKSFNDPGSEAKVLLASTKACSEGISLIGASRVVLLDVVWNPSVARQAVSRAFRLGQSRVVHVYNLITSGTIEEDKFKRQVKKDQLSELVLFSAERAECGGRSRDFIRDLPEEEKDRVLEKLLERENLKGIFKEIIYQPKDSKDGVDGSGPSGLIDLEI